MISIFLLREKGCLDFFSATAIAKKKYRLSYFFLFANLQFCVQYNGKEAIQEKKTMRNHVPVLYFQLLRMCEIFLEMYFRFLISEFWGLSGQEICFPKTEFSYKGVSCTRVFVIHNKEDFGRGKKIRWQ